MTKGGYLYLFVGCAAMLITSLPLATQVNAQQQNTKREAAIEKCRIAARKAYPVEIQDVARANVYKGCMKRAGFKP